MLKAWTFTVLLFLLIQLPDVPVFYGAKAFFLLFLLITFLICVLLGFYVRITLILSVLLLLILHKINPLPMGGGDSFLYNIGFLLMITPGLTGSTMPVWPERLLLWQLIVLYSSSAWQKLLGTAWIDGTAIGISLQHPHFARWELPVPFLESVSPLLSYGTIAWEFLWLLLLIPAWKYHAKVKMFLLITGIVFHLGILIFFEVGSFSFAMMVGYVGLCLPPPPIPRTELSSHTRAVFRS